MSHPSANPIWQRAISPALLLAVALVPAAASPYLYGIHDHEPDPSEFLNRVKLGTGGTGGWVTATVAIGANTNETWGVDFSALANAGHTVICRINYGYFPEGTIPVPTKYDDFASRIRSFVANSSGCTIWLIANETNLAVEWPFDPASRRFNYVSPASYAACFRKAYVAIKSVRPNDTVLPQALAPWAGPYGGTDNLNGTGHPADGMPLNWVQYLHQMLTAIAGSGPLDGIALHTGSRGYRYTDIHSTQKISAGGQSLYWSFYVYKDWVDYGIPPSLYHLPLYVTECNGLYYWKGGGPPGEDPAPHYETGWMQEIFAEFNRYNQFAATNGRPIIRCVNFYRWCAYCDGWNMDGRDNPYKTQILADLDASVAQLYRWPTNQITTNPPAAPFDLTASVGSGKVTLAWTAVGFATSYRLKRATGSGGPYTVIASNLTTTTFGNTSYTPNTTYYYRVSAVNAWGEGPDSDIASATPTNGLPDVIVTAINWTPTNLLGGTTVVFRATVRNQGSAPTPTSPSLPLGVGFDVSGGGNYTWATLSSPLAVGASVTLTATGGANGSPQWIASPGPRTVTAYADDINRFPEGLEDNNILSTDFTVFHSSLAVNSGGGAVGEFTPDSFVSGGYTFNVTNSIDIGGVPNPAPQAVYQSERWQQFTYALSDLMPGAIYGLRLHFAEIFVNDAGLRRFHVAINGSPVLTNLDVFAEAGGKFRALVKSFSAAADATGQITVSFVPGDSDWPKCSGLELSFTSPPINTPPTITPVADQLLNAGATATVIITATDTNLPPQILSYTLAPGALPGAAINTTNGVLTWTAPYPPTAQTNVFTVRVADNGSPPLTNSVSFALVVVPQPRFTAISATPNAIVFTWQTFPGKSYQLQWVDNLNTTNWSWGLNPAIASAFSLSATNLPVAPQQFYRVVQVD